MSVFLLNSDNETTEVESNNTTSATVQNPPMTEAAQALVNFWAKSTEEIKKCQNLDVRLLTLPLARVKKIMKLDEDVKMISAEAPVLFAKAAELFIQELTLRAWLHTEDNKRRTLQRHDIAMAISKYDQFDFLIDIVPRDEIKSHSCGRQQNKTAINADQVHYYFQLAQQHQAAMQGGGNSQVPIQVVQPTQIQAISVNQQQEIKSGTTATPQIVQIQSSPGQANAGTLQLVQQIVTPTGDVQHVPVQLGSSNQIQMIRMQGTGTSGQQLILQAAPSSNAPQPHILQVSQGSSSTPVFIQSTNGADST